MIDKLLKLQIDILILHDGSLLSRNDLNLNAENVIKYFYNCSLNLNVIKVLGTHIYVRSVFDRCNYVKESHIELGSIGTINKEKQNNRRRNPFKYDSELLLWALESNRLFLIFFFEKIVFI